MSRSWISLLHLLLDPPHLPIYPTPHKNNKKQRNQIWTKQANKKEKHEKHTHTNTLIHKERSIKHTITNHNLKQKTSKFKKWAENVLWDKTISKVGLSLLLLAVCCWAWRTHFSVVRMLTKTLPEKTDSSFVSSCQLETASVRDRGLRPLPRLP